MEEGFDRFAEGYDGWYDTPRGSAAFRAETACLRSLCAPLRGRWLEVGVGTGRFADALGATEGIDPSTRMLRLAAGRGIGTCAARAEALPFRSGAFDGVLTVLSLCFVDDPAGALRECRRVLRPGGRLLAGFIPADGPWGKAYERKKASGHPVYSMATFIPAGGMVPLAEGAGFRLLSAASTLLWPPDAAPAPRPRVEKGMAKGAGFVGMLFEAGG